MTEKEAKDQLKQAKEFLKNNTTKEKRDGLMGWLILFLLIAGIAYLATQSIYALGAAFFLFISIFR